MSHVTKHATCFWLWHLSLNNQSPNMSSVTWLGHMSLNMSLIFEHVTCLFKNVTCLWSCHPSPNMSPVFEHVTCLNRIPVTAARLQLLLFNYMFLGYLVGWQIQSVLVLGLCPECSSKLNYKDGKREVTKQTDSERDFRSIKAGVFCHYFSFWYFLLFRLFYYYNFIYSL